MTQPPPPTAAFRLALFYVGLFGAIGMHLPFWQVWLAEAKGLDPTSIGIVLAVTFATKVLVNPVVGQMVDKRGDRRLPMVVLATAATLAFCLFPLAEGVGALVLVTLLTAGTFNALLPLGENLTMIAATRHGLDYGRIRLWGSLAFIASATGVGALLTTMGIAILVWLIVGMLAFTTLTCVLIPDQRTAADAAPLPRLAPLLRAPLFLMFLGATSLVQVSHTVYYGFATLHWRAAGIGDGTVGLLWAEGVIAEVILFAFGNRIVRRIGPAWLIALGAAGGMLRWTVLGATTAVVPVALAQVLHAATFGATHLGAMHFIQRAVPHRLSARAQATYSAVTMGIAPGLAMLATGRLYDVLGGGAFLVMALTAAAGGAVALLLVRRWTGKPMTA